MDNAMKPSKPNNFETMKTKKIKFDIAAFFELNYHTIKLKTFCLKIVSPLKNKEKLSKLRETLN